MVKNAEGGTKGAIATHLTRDRKGCGAPIREVRWTNCSGSLWAARQA
jgi:hypothetical protein